MTVHHEPQHTPVPDEQAREFANLGTPPQAAQVSPVPAETDALRAQPTPTTPIEPARERRRGLLGLWDTLAYSVQWLIYTVFGAAELDRDVDPIEQLKRRYGREQRKF